MALNKLTYDDKETLVNLPSVANKNKCTASDMNSIKSVVNDAIDQVGENKNNIIVLDGDITNINGDINSINNDISKLQKGINYSTTEQQIGYWTDGKPLYKITLSLPTYQSLPNDHWVGLTHNLGVHEYIKISGNLVTTVFGEDKTQPIPRVVTDAIAQYGIGYGDLSSNEFRVQMGTNYSNLISGFVVFEYTKNSDY